MMIGNRPDEAEARRFMRQYTVTRAYDQGWGPDQPPIFGDRRDQPLSFSTAPSLAEYERVRRLKIFTRGFDREGGRNPATQLTTIAELISSE